MSYEIQSLEEIDSLVGEMRAAPKRLYYIGNLTLLQRPRIAIVGSRRPNSYTKQYTPLIAQKLSHAGVCIVSGGAMGVDALAHKGAGVENTIMVAGTGLDVRYPEINRHLIESIEQKGLVISQFEANTPSFKWNFPTRNELIVALSQALIVTQADLKSGTMHTVAFVRHMKKPIYVLPHRLGESEGTSMLLEKGWAKALYDIDALVEIYGEKKLTCNDDFLHYCQSTPLYNEAIALHAQKVFEYECLGLIEVKHGRIYTRNS